MTSYEVGESASPFVLSLRSVFAQASLQVSLAGLTDAERSRDIAFYDETLIASVRLIIPASEKTLPSPSANAQSSFSIPLSTSLEEDEEDIEEGYTNAPPKLLSLLISAMQISLDASYTAPRLGSLAGNSSNQPEASTSSNYLIPATQGKDAAYQNVPLPKSTNTGDVTQMFSKSWNGNSIPKDVSEKEASKKQTSRRNRADEQEEDNVKAGGEIWYVKGKGEGSWVTEWRCTLPVIFMRTRHPTPALILTALMTLKLQPSHLARMAPSLVDSSSNSASEILYLHDLLNPLSEGPSYPDESPAERAARANASLAKLPLGKLPSSILGSKLVTPARNAKEVGQIIASKTKRIATENGDMGDTNDNDKLKPSRGGRRILTNQGLMAFQLDLEGSVSTLSDDQVKGLGEEVMMLQRSARRVLDVQSAVSVRMRTVTVPGIQGHDHDVENSLLPTLVLCVEVENPVNSGMKFAMDQVDVVVSTPPSQTLSAKSKESRPIEVSMHRIGDVLEPLLVDQGSQSNILYRLVFDCPISDDVSDEEVMKSLEESHRNVSIKVLGRPVLMREDSGKVETYTPTKKFISTWTCTLDLIAQMRMVALQRVIHNGAGIGRLGGQIQERRQPQRIMSTSTIAPHSASTYLANLPLPNSPYSPLPRTPTEIRSATNSSLTPIQTSPTQMISHRRPSLRTATGATANQNDTLVSLHRSEMDRQDPSTSALPALSSALVGQSILARAKMNRSATMSSGKLEETRQLTNGKEGKVRNASERTITPTLRNAFPHYRKPMTEAVGGANESNEEVGREHLLPLGDRGSVATVQRLLSDPVHEQGLLIDVVALIPKTLSGQGKREASVEVQVENRSERTRTIIFSWRLPSSRTTESKLDSILLEEDDVQVGPLQRGDSEIVILKLCFTESGVQQLPPLAVYDTTSGVEKVLQGMQSIVV